MTQLELTPHGIVVCRDSKLAAFAESEAAGLLARLPKSIKALEKVFKQIRLK